MPVLVQVWDKTAADGKGAFVEMFSLNANAAVKNDPGRYSLKKPGDEPKSVRQERVRLDADPEEIPEDWQNLPWPQRKKLAQSLGADRNCTSDIANAIIGAEVRRHAKAPPPAAPPPGADVYDQP